MRGKLLFAVGLALMFSGVASAHALPKTLKVAAYPVTHVAVVAKVVTVGAAHGVGGFLFTLENGIDVVHEVYDGLDKGLYVITDGHKVPLLSQVAEAVEYGDKIVGYADTGTEDLETILFGYHN